MSQDPRYGSIKILLESGHIKIFGEIFHFIPKTTVYKDLGINFNRFDRAIVDPSIFRLEELEKLGDLFDVDTRMLIDMAYAQMVSKRKTRTAR